MCRSHHSDVPSSARILFSLLDDPVQADHWAQYISGTPPDSAREPTEWRLGSAERSCVGAASEQMRADAEAAVATFAEDDQWRPISLLCLGVAELASAEADRRTFLEPPWYRSTGGVAQGTAAASALVYRAGDRDGPRRLGCRRAVRGRSPG